MARLERDIADSVASAEKVAELVATLPSDTVSAPRNISVPMRRRLDDIAGRHGGSIPLHGRLFAQWMHHAFPNECPFPHMSGSLESPLDPMRVLMTEEESGLRLAVSQEEMQSFVDAALSFNISDPIAAAQEPPLPWTEEEELMAGTLAEHSMGKAKCWLRLATLALAISSAAIGLVRMLAAVPASAFSADAEKGSSMLKVTGSALKPDLQCV